MSFCVSPKPASLRTSSGSMFFLGLAIAQSFLDLGPSLREGPGSASVPSGSPDPVAGTGAGSGERAIAVESRIDKLSAPAGRPGSRLVPGQGKPVGREKAENKEYRRGRRQQDGGRKRGAEGPGTAASLLMGTRSRDGGGRQNRGKTGLTTQENECEKGKLRLRENRR